MTTTEQSDTDRLTGSRKAAMLNALPDNPAELRYLLAAYLRRQGYEETTVAGDWVHRRTEDDIEVLTFEAAVAQQIALATTPGQPDAPTHLYANQYGTDLQAVGDVLDQPALTSAG